MKIGIITQPLLNNYGGILQNYALQEVLRNLGHNPITIDYIPKTPLWNFFKSIIKTFILRVVGKNISFSLNRKFWGDRKEIFSLFVNKYISKTKSVFNYRNIKKLDDFDMFIVGSDQIWRPKFIPYIEKDVFLDFCKYDKKLKRVAYAISFGSNQWEFSPEQTEICSMLAKKFDAISVREESGVNLCKEHFGVDATWVLDPTLLLARKDYDLLCKEIPVEKGSLVAYVLDMNDSIYSMCVSVAKERSLSLKIMSADAGAEKTIPEWLAMFRDASYVVTDSFHGTVLSIIFGKEFKCLYNKKRGSARFDSLLKLYESGKLDEMRDFSMNWLKNALK